MRFKSEDKAWGDGTCLKSQHLGGRGSRISEFQASVVYKVTRTAWAIQRNPVSKNQKDKCCARQPYWQVSFCRAQNSKERRCLPVYIALVAQSDHQQPSSWRFALASKQFPLPPKRRKPFQSRLLSIRIENVTNIILFSLKRREFSWPIREWVSFKRKCLRSTVILVFYTFDFILYQSCILLNCCFKSWSFAYT